MIGQGYEVCPRVCIPQTDGIIFTRTREAAPIRTIGKVIDMRCMSNKGLFNRPRGSVPEVDNCVQIATGEGFSIWAERDAGNVIAMRFKRLY